jgi:ABC-type dipeptide/oligopeptide/nickel transport system permease component
MNQVVDFVKTKSKVTIILAIVSIVYCVSATNVLLMTTGMIRNSSVLYLNHGVMITYCVIAFVWSIFLSVYFLINALGRRRRRHDQAEPEESARTA